MSKQKIILAVVLAALVGFLGWWWWRRHKDNTAVVLPPVASLGGTGGALSGVALAPMAPAGTFATTLSSAVSNWLRF